MLREFSYKKYNKTYNASTAVNIRVLFSEYLVSSSQAAQVAYSM